MFEHWPLYLLLDEYVNMINIQRFLTLSMQKMADKIYLWIEMTLKSSEYVAFS